MKITNWFLAPVMVLPFAFLTGCHSVGGTAKNSFTDWPAGSAPAAVAGQLARNFAGHQFEFVTNPTKRKAIIYPEVISEYGSLEAARLTGDQPLQDRLIKKFEPYCQPEGESHVSTVRHVDFEVFGIVPLEIYHLNHDQAWRSSGLGFADRQWSQTTPDGITDEARYWIDDMYMITALETEAFRASGQTQYLDRAALTMTAYLNRLQQPNGLFYHGTNSPFFWSRGNGWVAAGMTELLRSLPENHPQRPAILAGYQKMMAALLKFQGQDGLWRQLVDDPEAWPETSGSAMFTYALVTGVKRGWLDESFYAPVARKAWIALTGRLDANGNLRDVCVGTDKGSTREYYLQRPRETGNLHGQAPMLWTAAALLR
jgi:rhamnogalacturonyl hydrolase YesR